MRNGTSQSGLGHPSCKGAINQMQSLMIYQRIFRPALIGGKGDRRAGDLINQTAFSSNLCKLIEFADINRTAISALLFDRFADSRIPRDFERRSDVDEAVAASIMAVIWSVAVCAP